MKKKTVIAILMIAALTACGKEEPRGAIPAQTEDGGQTDNTDSNNPDTPGDPVIDVTDVPGSTDDPDNVDTEVPGPEDDELIYGECKAERSLQKLDESELPGDIGMCLGVFTDFDYSLTFDHTDTDDLERRLKGFIDLGFEMYQLDDLKIDRERFVSGDKEDPRGGYTDYGYYFSMDKENTDRWFAAFYSCSEEDIEKINKRWDSSTVLDTTQRYDEESGSLYEISMRRDPYCDDGRYYFYDIDSWADAACAQGRVSRLEPEREIDEIAYDGVFYYVRYSEYDAWDYYSNNDSSAGLKGIEHDIVIKWKEQDGKQFWSLYYMDMGKFPE